MHRKRIGAIDFLKFLFALMIVIFHGRNLGNPENPLFISGKIAVEFFFIVSGYLMAAKAERVSKQENLCIGTETISFIAGKIKNLFPHTLLAFIIGYIVLLVLSGNPIAFLKGAPYSIWEVSFLWMSGLGSTWVNGQTWYLSSMILVMIVLYPLIIKDFDRFTYATAPAIAIFVLGWIAYAQGTLATHKGDAWTGLVFNGNLRALSEICIGCVSYLVAQRLCKVNLTKNGSVLLAIIEISLYATIFVWGGNTTSYDVLFVCIFLLFFAVAITFSGKSAVSNFFNKKVFYWLGNFSFILYLNHITVGTVIKKIDLSLPYLPQIIIYIVTSFLLSLVCYFIGLGVKKIWTKHLPSFKQKLIH